MERRAWLKPALQGLVVGGIGVPLIGLFTGMLVFGGTAESRADARASTAVTAALVPVCVAQSKADPAATTKIAEFKALSAYQRTDFVVKSGWATMPEGTAANSALARACAEALSSANAA